MITWKQLCQSTLTAVAAPLYTAPPKTSTAIQQATAWNPTAGAVIMKVYIAPPGGGAGDTTTIWSVSVPAGTAVPIPQIIGHKLQAGQLLFGAGAGVTLTISGAENS